MRINCGDCNTTETISEDFWYDFKIFEKWAEEKHGHYPHILTCICACGEVFSTGPGLFKTVTQAHADELAEWLQKHEKHEAAHA
jgi:hypothetical protein